jgi:hypothetical protein
VWRPARRALSIVGIGIEVIADPFSELGMAFVLWVLDGFEELGIASGAAAVFRRAASAYLDQARVEHAGFRIGEAFHVDRVLPAIAEVIEIDELLGTHVFEDILEPSLAASRKSPVQSASGLGVLQPTSPARSS